jgi:phage gp36-like protein
MYCNQYDILTRIPERELINLTQDNPTSNSGVDSAILNENISLSSELIDGFVSGKYSIQKDNIPEIIRSIAVDITVYRLYSRRPQKINDTIKTLYTDALNLLKQIQNGTITLSIKSKDEKSIPLKNVTVRSNKTTTNKVFTDNFLAGY